MGLMHDRWTLLIDLQGAFFPFHRLYLLAHEVALREECNYTGYHP
jgi:hypothetical protein